MNDDDTNYIKIKKRILAGIKSIIKTPPSKRNKKDVKNIESISKNLEILKGMKKPHVVIVKRIKKIEIDR